MPHPRKEAAAEREREKKSLAKAEVSKKLEDAKWVDDGDKVRKAKEERMAARDFKADEQAKKEREKAELLRAEEESNAKLGKQGKLLPKIKRSDIRISALSAMVVDTRKPKKKVSEDLVHELPLIPNLNREASLEEARTGIKTEVASGTTSEAVSALTAALGNVSIDAHPERRRKAAHTAFEERRLKELMIEKPGLKRTQYKEMIFKEWQKSPENPMRTLI